MSAIQKVVSSDNVLVTGVAIMVLNEKNQILTSLRKDQLHNFPQGYEIPMGKLRIGETLTECAQRELQEETGM